MAREKSAKQVEETPWSKGDPSKKISLNVPFPEPLMMQLDWLLERNAIRSKSSFIRDAVANAAAEEATKVLRLQKALRELDEREKSGR